MSGYIGTQPVPQATQTRDAFTATAGQTSFATSGYTPNFLDVFLNGVKLAAADYTATNGSDVVLASGAVVNDILEVVAYTTFESDSGTFTGVVTANAGVKVDNITIDGTTIALSSGDLTLDVAGNITLDADDAGEIRLKDGGTQYGALKIDSSRLKIQSIISDADMLFAGNDGGSEITALTLDMSASGAATFNSSVTSAGLHSTTAGTSNFIAGVNAGNSITSGGNFNVTVGDEAGTAITTGDDNTFIGYASGDATTTAGGNTAVGSSALSTNTTGADNVAIGEAALLRSTTASNNTAVGNNALRENTTGTENTAIGASAGDALTTSNANVAVGKSALSAETSSNGNTAIGSEALRNQNVGGSGDARNTAVGLLAGASVSTGINNTLIGALAGDALTDADHNVAIGISALSADTLGGRSVAVGAFALLSQNFTSATDAFNTAVGYDAGRLVTTGVKNTLIGGLAGDSLTEGDDNIALGYNALSTEDTGSKSIAIGFEALKNQNNAASNHNVAIGHAAGTAVTTGIQNTLIGGNAGNSIQSGGNNINIGFDVDSGHDAFNTITIGENISGADNDFSFGKASNVVHNDFDADANWSRSSDERLKKNITNQTLGLDFINDLRTVKYNWKASNELDASDAQLAHLRRQDADGNIINDMNTTVTMHNFIAQEVKAALDTAGVSNFAGWKEDQNGVQQVSREMFVIPLVKAVQELSTALDAALARITTLEGE